MLMYAVRDQPLAKYPILHFLYCPESGSEKNQSIKFHICPKKFRHFQSFNKDEKLEKYYVILACEGEWVTISDASTLGYTTIVMNLMSC